ncbi:MAG: threonine synthase [Acidimicrobiia bacterium]
MPAPPFIDHLECTRCGRTYRRGLDGPCPRCGPDGVLDIVFDVRAAGRSLNRRSLKTRARDIWRYRELLPVSAKGATPPLPVGWTPITSAPRLAAWAGVRTLLVKDEGRNPTASFKDRASVVACASTGNAASSLAGAAAAVGLTAVIFVPEFAPEPKVAQLMIFGARVIRVKGSYDETWELCQRACARHGWYNRNAAVNPSLVEGKKTCGLEIGEQMGAEAPEWVAVSVGDGCTITGIWKGLGEMRALGFITHLPRMLGVQAEGARPLVDAFEGGGDMTPSAARTVADSICVGHPRNWRKALRAVRASGGALVAVPDEAILDAMRAAGQRAGLFGEPAGVAGLAGVRAAVEKGIIAGGESVLAVVTGSGLKDARTAMSAAGQPFTLAPTDDAVDAHLEERPLA